MPDRYIFADEAGCFTFNREPNVSKYFILCSVCMDDCEVGTSLTKLRRHLAWEGAQLGEYFHACTDKQEIRNSVFSCLCEHNFTIQATIMEKSKAQPQVRETKPIFYQYGWYYHFKHGASKEIPDGTEALVTAASLGNRKERVAFKGAVHSVMKQTAKARKWAANFCPAHADPCLQVADYCAWAIQRKYERSDERSYDLIADRITYEYDLWRHGNHHHY